MAVDWAREALNSSMSSATSTMRDALRTAHQVEELQEQAPEYGARLEALVQQMYAVADLARDVERALAEIHAERRAGAS